MNFFLLKYVYILVYEYIALKSIMKSFHHIHFATQFYLIMKTCIYSFVCK